MHRGDERLKEPGRGPSHGSSASRYATPRPSRTRREEEELQSTHSAQIYTDQNDENIDRRYYSNAGVGSTIKQRCNVTKYKYFVIVQ